MTQPFLTLYTPTYRRPAGLARCLASVQAQTAVAQIEQIVIPDHIGVGIGGMFQAIQKYADAVHGRYVHILADDDELASPDVVASVQIHAAANQYPEVIVVKAQKGGSVWPDGSPWPPRLGHVDLGCFIVRADVWKQHVTDYGNRYEGDWDHAIAMFNAGRQASWCDVLFLRGGVSRGVAEAA